MFGYTLNMSQATGRTGGGKDHKEQTMIKEWSEMSEVERAAERALPKAERQHRALLRSLERKSPKASTGRLFRSKRGTWGRVLTSGCRRGCVAALTRHECETLSLTPGPGNF
jgi:anti-sigma factor RsiW